jgi:hypothetical protein
MAHAMRPSMTVAARLIVLLLALCLSLDSAMPLLPGAFRLEDGQSVEAGGRAAPRVIGVVMQAARPAGTVAVVREVRPGSIRAARGRLPVPRAVPVHRPSRADSTSDAPSD